MRLLIAALALSLTVLGQTAFAVDTCRLDCTTTIECDGFCEQVGWEYCDPWWAIIEVCQPFDQAALQELDTSSATPWEGGGFQPSIQRTGQASRACPGAGRRVTIPAAATAHTPGSRGTGHP
jgi:hypothetical protein